MLVCVKISEKCRFGSKICKYVDLVKNFQLKFGQICRKPWFWSKLSKISNLVNIYENLDFGQSLWKFWFRPKWWENLDLGQHFRKISILVNILGKIDFGHFPQILVLVKISEKCRLGSKFAIMSILVKITKKSRFSSKFSKISLLVKIVEKSQMWSNLSKYFNFRQNCRKFSILVKI